MALFQWSTTPASNATAGSINWAEGQAPSTVNDSARQMMADVATYFQSPEWLNYGLTPTFVSGTQFTVAGNKTSTFTVGRRVKATIGSGTLYGTITASVFTTLTTVTVAWGAGSLDSSVSEVDVGVLDPANPSLPSNIPATLSSLTVNEPGSSASTITLNAASDTSGANLKLIGNGVTTPSKTIRANSGNFQVINDAYNAVLLTLDDAGNLTATGNLTAFSDARLKTDIEQITSALARVRKLKGVTYRRKDIDQGVRQTGLIAQDVQRVMPEAVREGPDGYLSVAYGNLMGLVCEAINELADQVEALKVAK